MLISRQWLSDFVDLDDVDLARFGELITTRVAEVDHIYQVGEPVRAAKVARVESVRPHKERPALVVATVTTGTDRFDVVCGAPNCKAGMLTIFVPPGSDIESASGKKRIESVEVGGERSAGVLVSEMELGLTADHSGIVDLTSVPGLAPGDSIEAWSGAPDVVVEIDNKSLTHRPDLWGHLGFARELSALLKRPLRLPAAGWTDDTEEGVAALAALGGSAESRFRVQIDPKTGSKRFTAIEITGAKTEPSPLWMRRRLSAVGGGVRNLLIDLSNYVMRDVGQPNHAYDVARLSGSTIAVRFARAGETFEGLDGITRELTTEDVIIADEQGVVGFGGIMGGARSSVQDSTTHLFLESAHFDPVSIRRAMKRHALRTDASNRFEKNRSPYASPLALHRFVSLLKSIQPGISLPSRAVSEFPDPPKRITVSSSYSYLRSRLGADWSDEVIGRTLRDLEFRSVAAEGDTFTVAVPCERATRDISHADDLVEEVGRSLGYENIPERAPAIASTASRSLPIKGLEDLLRSGLFALGFSECALYSFMSAERADAIGYAASECFELENPVDATIPVLRTSLVPNMIEAVDRNARHTDAIALFEIGRAYRRPKSMKDVDPALCERRLLSFAYVGRDGESTYKPRMTAGAELYAAISVLKKLISATGAGAVTLTRPEDVVSAPAASLSALRPWMHPFRSAVVEVNGTVVGIVSEVRQGVLTETRRRAVVAELDLETLLPLTGAIEQFQELSKYPDSYFEMSVVMPDQSEFRALESSIRASVESQYLRGIEVLDVYRGQPLAEGTKSVSVKLSLGAADRTLSPEELTKFQAALVQGVEREFALRR